MGVGLEPDHLGRLLHHREATFAVVLDEEKRADGLADPLLRLLMPTWVSG